MYDLIVLLTIYIHICYKCMYIIFVDISVCEFIHVCVYGYVYVVCMNIQLYYKHR